MKGEKKMDLISIWTDKKGGIGDYACTWGLSVKVESRMRPSSLVWVSGYRIWE